MPTLPKAHDSLIQTFAPHFSNCIWQHAQVLLIGAILAPGRRTVTAVLRIMGLSDGRQFQTYYRVLNRATWSSWALSHTLLKLLVQTFVPKGPIVCGIDDTIEHDRVPRHRHLHPVQVATPRASIAIRCIPATATSSKPVGCAG